MRTRYLTGMVEAKRQTALAFCCSFNWSDDHGYVASDQWIPLSVILDHDHVEIEEACEGDIIEISVAEWWLKQELGG